MRARVNARYAWRYLSSVVEKHLIYFCIQSLSHSTGSIRLNLLTVNKSGIVGLNACSQWSGHVDRGVKQSLSATLLFFFVVGGTGLNRTNESR